MRVLHVISSLGIGGAERLISDMLPQMKTAGVDVSLLVYRRLHNDFEKKLEDAGVAIISLEAKSNYSPRIIFSLANAMKNFDIIHVHLFPALYQVAVANVFCRRKLIFTEHCTTNRRRQSRLFHVIERIVYSQYSRLVSVSEETQESLMVWLNERNNRYSVILNGIDLKAFCLDKEKNDFPYTVLMVSRFAEQKDQAALINALQWIREDVHVVFVGDGDTKASCEELARENGVAERCHFMGVQSDIPYWVSKADIGVLSTHWEGLPLTIIEMMAGGLPVIASEVDGVRQVVDGAGLMFPEGNDKALAEMINQLITNPDYRKQIAERCYERASLYDIRQTVQSYIEIYQSIYHN